MIKRYKNTRKNIGQYIPKNPNKYVGQYPIVVRSTWERKFCQWLDVNFTVLEWSSENIVVPYYDPVRMKYRRYFPDFWMKIKNKDDTIDKYIVEIKPLSECAPPKKGRKTAKTLRLQEATYLTNQAKFRAADGYCQKMGYKFKIMTERELFNK